MKKYVELYRKLKDEILSKKYSFGDKLESKRTMADKLGVSVITVEKAYSMLLDEGYIYARERSGYYVSELNGLAPLPTIERVKPPLLEEESEDEGEDFEYSVYIKTLRRVVSEKRERIFIKTSGKGCAALRNAISEYLFRYRGMYAPPQRIVIGSGSEQLYESIVKLLGREKLIGIEDPSYSQIEAVYSGMGVRNRKLPMASDGISSGALSDEIDVLHVTPFHSYPSGVTASMGKRGEYLEWSKKNGGYIIEDDFDSEFFLPGQPIETLYSMDKNDSVIYINTFSKSLSPAMRIGYMILPESLMEKYEATLGIYSCTVPALDQYVLAEFISSGSFERHLNRKRRGMRK